MNDNEDNTYGIAALPLWAGKVAPSKSFIKSAMDEVYIDDDEDDDDDDDEDGDGQQLDYKTKGRLS